MYFLLITFFLSNSVTPFDLSFSLSFASLIANNFLIFEALFGPNLLGIFKSVNPGISFSPFLTMATERTQISEPIIQPRIDFLFL